MDIETIGLLAETIEQCCEVNKNLVSSEIFINDGELGRSQVMFGGARDLLATMKDDVFKELLEAFCLEAVEPKVEDFTTLDLVKEISVLVKNCGTLVGMYVDDETEAVLSIVENKIAQNISNVINIYQQLFN